MLGSLISPRVGLGIIRKQLESELNAHLKVRLGTNYKFKPVNAFKLCINNLEHRMFFIVDDISYTYNEGETLSKLINTMVAQKLGDKIAIDLIVITYGENVSMIVAFQKDGTKQQKEILL